MVRRVLLQDQDGDEIDVGADGSMPIKNWNDFKLSISAGNIKGHRSYFKAMQSPVIGLIEQTLWDDNSQLVWPTTGETLEIHCEDANDTAAGTGARAILITGLKETFEYQTEIIATNGATTGPLDFTDWIHIENISVSDSGSNETSHGKIILRVVSAGAIRAVSLPGNSRSFNGTYVTPLGRSAFIDQVIGFTPKGEDTILTPFIKPFGSNTWINGGSVPTYQNQVGLTYQSKPRMPEKTRIEWKALSPLNENIFGSMTMEIIEIENEFLDMETIQQLRVLSF